MSLSKATTKRTKMDPSSLMMIPFRVPTSPCTLSDDALLHIFAYFPLQQIISIFRRVCTRWNQAVLTLCQCKRSLKLFPSISAVISLTPDPTLLPQTTYDRHRLRPIGADHDLIISAPLNLDSVSLFHRLFPRIDCLLIAESKNTFVPTLGRLLSGWPNLVSFSLYGTLTPGDRGALQQAQFYEALGKLSQLRSLDLLVDGLLGVQASLKVMAPILGRLEHFSCPIGNSRAKDFFLSALTPALCTSLTFGNFPPVYRNFTQFSVDFWEVPRVYRTLPAYLTPVLQLNPQLGAIFQQVSSLTVTKRELTVQCVAFIATHFPALTQLTLDWDLRIFGAQLTATKISLEPIVNRLCVLRHLSTLRLRFPGNYLLETMHNSRTASSRTCSSVRHLTLQVHKADNERELARAEEFALLSVTHTRLLYTFLAAAFPSLETLALFQVSGHCRLARERPLDAEAIQSDATLFTATKWPPGQCKWLEIGERQLTEGFGRHQAHFRSGNLPV